MLRHQDIQGVLRVALVMASVSLTTTAHANGRPPVTNGVFFQANDNQSLYVRSTFGLLISHDGGCSFRWTCEQNIGYGGPFDPMYAIAADGTLFATTYTGLRVSRDHGCSFTTATAELPADAPGRIADMWVDAVDIGPTGEIWVATSDSMKPNDVLRSTDGGVTFVSRGMSSPVMSWKSVVVAPSDAMHVYISGYQMANTPPTAQVFSTIDGGQHWTPASLAGVQLAGTPTVTVAAIAPTDPKHVYLVSVGANGLGDRLYRSTDGGASFREVLTTTRPIANVVIRDAMTVFAASGEGTFRSDDGGTNFGAAVTAPQLGCLGKRPDGTLVGCAANWDPDFMAVGRSDDTSQWQKIFRFIELDGPLACPAGTAGHDMCDQQLWPGIKDQFGVTGPMCSTATDLPFDQVDAVAPPRSGGCCDAGDRSPLGLGLVGLLTAWRIGRRGDRGRRRR
jgi:photosystem II stability/assembly factor-like uncharacterized protein